MHVCHNTNREDDKNATRLFIFSLFDLSPLLVRKTENVSSSIYAPLLRGFVTLILCEGGEGIGDVIAQILDAIQSPNETSIIEGVLLRILIDTFGVTEEEEVCINHLFFDLH